MKDLLDYLDAEIAEVRELPLRYIDAEDIRRLRQLQGLRETLAMVATYEVIPQ